MDVTPYGFFLPRWEKKEPAINVRQGFSELYDLAGFGAAKPPRKYLSGGLEAPQRFQTTRKKIDFLAGLEPAKPPNGKADRC